VSLIRSYTSVLSTKFTLLAAVILSLFGVGAKAFAAPAQTAPILEIHRIADILKSTHLAPVLYLGILVVVVGVLHAWLKIPTNRFRFPTTPKTPST
jgi:hypothetical protein